MNRPTHLLRSQDRRAFALVLVLITVSLVAVITAFFLASTSRERTAASVHAESVKLNQLADMPVNLVMGLVNAATRETITEGEIRSWTSQPGMLRTFGPTGDLANVYRLYSWNDLAVAGTNYDPFAAENLPPNAWGTQTAHYIDLNEPLNDVYPILDPRSEGAVEGFSVDESDGVVSGSGSAAPMPVKWLYILADGQWVAPTGGSGDTATFDSSIVTADNPVIGRIAFWTDDETAKVNINTASEGTFWDLPKSGSDDDMQFIANPPVKGEYQRVAGHPSITSLSPVFPELRSVDFYKWSTSGLNTHRTELESIYGMVPRIAWGGSRGGTFPAENQGYDMTFPPPRGWVNSNPPAPTIYPDSDRLYATSEELWFKPNRDRQSALTSHLGVDTFRQRQFFLTANSRAPETTLNGTPRVSLWPITWPYSNAAHRTRDDRWRAPVPSSIPNPDTTPLADNEWMTAEEKLLAFCGSLNWDASQEDRYFFQRQNPESPRHDWDIQRNRDLVGYIRTLMDLPTPGYGGSLSSRIGTSSSDWLALNSFDYSRSLINQGTAPDLNRGVVYSYTGLAWRWGRFTNGPSGNYTSGRVYGGGPEPNAFATVPLRASLNGNTYETLGAFPRLEEVVVMFYATERREPEPPTEPEHTRNPYQWKHLINPGPAFGGIDQAEYPVGSQTTEMRAVVLLDLANMMPGIDHFGPTFWMKVSGGSFLVNGSPIGLPAGSGRSVQMDMSRRVIAPYVVWPLFKGKRPKSFNNSPPSGEEANFWSLLSNAITMDPSATTFDFSGSPLTVSFYAPYSDDINRDPTTDDDQFIQSKVIDFSQWNGQLPVPVAPRWSKFSLKYASNFPPLASGGGYDRPDPSNPNPNGGDLPSGIPSDYTQETRDARWAWSEYAPRLTTNSGQRDRLYSGNLRSNGKYDMQGRPSYLYRLGVIREYETSGNTGDVHDQTQPNLLFSTNLRKRVDACNQRNTAKTRGVFFHEGTDPSALIPPPSGQEWRGWQGGPDAFLTSNDASQMTAYPLVTPYDTIISMVVDDSAAGGGQGDPRLTSQSTFTKISNVISGRTPDEILPATDPGGTNRYYPRPSAAKQFHHLGTPGMSALATGYKIEPALSNGDPFGYVVGLKDNTSGWTGLPAYGHYQGTHAGGDLRADMTLPTNADWTTHPGVHREGGLIERPDQDYQQFSTDTSGADRVPFYNNYALYYQDTTNTTGSTNEISLFSPNRQVTSPIKLGTLPRSDSVGWQTMTFSPHPADSNHPGLPGSSNTAPDHLYLDYFWMPVAEPYPISDRLSTAGKINLNYQILPFTYIKRQTGIHALMKATWVFALPDQTIGFFESGGMRASVPSIPGSAKWTTRHKIDIDETLAAFEQKFQARDVFRSASQLCEVELIPEGQSLSSIDAFWNNHKYTADNAREQPYDHLYSRVTTKSNTFTVHWRVQSLKKARETDAATWNERLDSAVAELRGSSLIERYIDPNATDIPDYATDTSSISSNPLASYYKWRTVTNTQFKP